MIDSRHRITSRNKAELIPDAIFARNSYIKDKMVSCLLDSKYYLYRLLIMAIQKYSGCKLEDWAPNATSMKEYRGREFWVGKTDWTYKKLPRHTNIALLARFALAFARLKNAKKSHLLCRLASPRIVSNLRWLSRKIHGKDKHKILHATISTTRCFFFFTVKCFQSRTSPICWTGF